jgi:hypothetical protein
VVLSLALCIARPLRIAAAGGLGAEPGRQHIDVH